MECLNSYNIYRTFNDSCLEPSTIRKLFTINKNNTNIFL